VGNVYWSAELAIYRVVEEKDGGEGVKDKTSTPQMRKVWSRGQQMEHTRLIMRPKTRKQQRSGNNVMLESHCHSYPLAVTVEYKASCVTTPVAD